MKLVCCCYKVHANSEPRRGVVGTNSGGDCDRKLLSSYLVQGPFLITRNKKCEPFEGLALLNCALLVKSLRPV
jgi:hypothetical protein